ncbi:ChrR family anti-sigma-E factor [Sulfitobacter sp. LCG007]
MTTITHHIPEHLVRAYAAGSLPYGFALVVAAHVSVCDTCRAQLEAEELAGGAMLDSLAPSQAGEERPLLEDLLDRLDTPPRDEQECAAAGIYPAPVMTALSGRPPKWRALGGGIRQSILAADRDSSVRLLHIPPGQAVPDHGHRGLELTMVLQGSFHDETGEFRTGDVEVADGDLEHVPVAGTGMPCICLAATDAPLNFRSLVPRLLQPVFRI